MSEQETIIIDPREAERRGRDLVRTVLGVAGLLSLVIGLLILFNPVESGSVMMKIIAAIFASYTVIAGLVFIGAMIFSRRLKGWRRFGTALVGLLYLIVGIVVFGNLSSMAVVLAAFLSIFIGVMWIFEGIMSFATVSESSAKAITIIYGIISVIAGIVLIFTPILGAVTLWVILGAAMTVMGVVQIVRAFQIKKK